MDITLTMRQQKRIEIIERALRNDLTVVEAAMVLGVSERQCYRIKARVKDQGVKGVLHGNRGRPCKYKLKDQTIKRVVELARGKYRGFNDHHLTEKLKEEEKIEISREKVRRVLRSNGIGSPRKRRANKHRSRRERREAEGMMLQTDGSPHDWLEGRGPPLTLVGAIDDATSKVPLLSLNKPRPLGLTSICLMRSLRKKGSPIHSTPIAIRSFGPIGSRHCRNSSGGSGPPQKWDEL